MPAIALIAAGWKRVYAAAGTLDTSGIYAWVRHPQYTGIFIVTLAFMIQWPTLLTLLLWPVVIWMFTGWRGVKSRMRWRSTRRSTARTGSGRRCSFPTF